MNKLRLGGLPTRQCPEVSALEFCLTIWGLIAEFMGINGVVPSGRVPFLNVSANAYILESV